MPALAKLALLCLKSLLLRTSRVFLLGHDGVNSFAPTRLYGTPDDCRTY